MERPHGLVPGVLFIPSIDILCEFHSQIVRNPLEFQHSFIRFADVYSEPPDQLTERYWADEDNRVWFFFTKISTNCAENGGNKTCTRCSAGPVSKWRVSQVKHLRNRNGKIVGFKRTFDYVIKTKGSKQGFKKTPWLMEEYSFNINPVDKLHEWVICKIHISPRSHPLSECLPSSSVPCKHTSYDECKDIVEAVVGASGTLVLEKRETEKLSDDGEGTGSSWDVGS